MYIVAHAAAFLWGSGQRSNAEGEWERLQEAEDGLGAALYNKVGRSSQSKRAVLPAIIRDSAAAQGEQCNKARSRWGVLIAVSGPLAEQRSGEGAESLAAPCDSSAACLPVHVERGDSRGLRWPAASLQVCNDLREFRHFMLAGLPER